MNTTNKVKVGDTTTSTSTSTTASQWQTYNHYRAEQGWECPRCGRINAPWVRQCDCSRSDRWDITWRKNDYTKPWWYDYKITCNGTPVQTQIDSDTFKVHPETTTWKTPSSVCGSDSTTNVKSNPNSIIYTTATNPTVGGSDYWDNMSQVWTNNPHVSNKIDPNTATTAQNSGPSTQTIHNGKINYKE